MSIKKTDVLGNLVYASVSMACANEIPGYNGTLFAISEETKERIEADLVAARAAVAELIEASERTIRAFEALGNANSVLPTRLAHMECESAMVAQKAALANVGSAS